MADGPLNFEEHRRQREQGLVRCARCGKMILGTLTRCPECGVHFDGEAQDYTHPSDRGRGGAKTWVTVVALLLLLAFLLILFR